MDNPIPLKTTRHKLLIGVTLAVFLTGFFPAIADLVKKWSASEDYTHAFFSVPIVAFMVWRERERFFVTGKPSSYIGLAGLVFSIPLYIISLKLQIPTITSLTMVMAIISILIFLGGVSVLKHLAIPIVLLILLIPIPNQIYSAMTIPLQLKVSQISKAIIQIFGIPVLRTGNILSIPGKTFEIVEACSGMRSLIMLATLSLIFSYFMLQRGSLKIVLLASSIPIAIAVNIIRVLSLVFAYHWYRLDLSEGASHTILGLGVFCIALAGLFGIQRLLERWDIPPTPADK